MACVNEGSRSFTCSVHKWNEPCLPWVSCVLWMSYKIFRKFVLYVGSVQASLLPTYRTSREGTAVGCVCLSVRLFSLYLLNYLTYVTHTHTRLTALCPGLPRWAGTRQAKPIWILLKQETVSGSGISWAICKSAPGSRQITTLAAHHSVFLQARCPSCCPTNSVKALKEALTCVTLVFSTCVVSGCSLPGI